MKTTTGLHRAASLLESFRDLDILVAGDLILDDYVEGEVERISPEAPVPVVRARSSFQRLGGAGNVANACVALGARVSLYGALGNDSFGDIFLRECDGAGIDTSGIDRRDDRPTIRKLRVLSRHQQILRLDWERREPLGPEVVRPLLTELQAGRRPDALILSDYNKGFFTPESLSLLISRCRESDQLVLVDPKSDDFSHYRGASILTPNLAEVEKATGRRLADADRDSLIAAAAELLEQSEARALCITLGARGMLVVERDGSVAEVAAAGRDVYDVTGAGDTVLGVLALSLAAGADLAEAARLANVAAGIAVGKVGTAVVEPRELLLALSPHPGEKVLRRSDLAARCSWWRLQQKKIVFTNGCYDLLHAGHLKLLHEAAKHGDVLVVAINSDRSVADLKGPGRPLIPEDERAALLAAFGDVDGVVVFDEETPLALIEEIIPDVLVKGADYAPGQVVGRDFVERHGGRLVLVDLMPERSTSALVDRMAGEKSGDDRS